jgi:hypothetical protein
MQNGCSAATAAPPLDRPTAERDWSHERDGWQAGAERVFDRAGKRDKHRCTQPVIASKDTSRGRIVNRNRCHKCDECIAHKKSVRIARTMHVIRNTHRTWFDTRTYGWTDILQWMTDSRDQRWWDLHWRERESAEARQHWFDHEAQRQKANFHKRLRKLGAVFKQSTNTERHESELRHFHCFLHETADPILHLQLVAATFIMPKGSRRPTRRPHEGSSQYWKRVVSDLYTGWRRWQELRDLPGEAARQERLRLPVQVTRIPRAGTRVIWDNRRRRKRNSGKAVGYAAKAAGYSVKDGGRWSHSPGYPPKTPQQGAGTPSAKAHTGGAATGNPKPCRSHSITERCRGAASKQELGAYGTSDRPPRPPSQGPPKWDWQSVIDTLTRINTVSTNVWTPEAPGWTTTTTAQDKCGNSR